MEGCRGDRSSNSSDRREWLPDAQGKRGEGEQGLRLAGLVPWMDKLGAGLVVGAEISRMELQE